MQEEEKDILITKYLSGELSTEENAKVDAWIDLDEENKRYFHEMKSIWEMVDDTHVQEIQFDVDQAWTKVKKRNESPSVVSTEDVDEHQQTKEVVIQIQRRSWWMAAAAVLLISIMGWLVLQQPRTPEMLTLMASNELIEVQLPDGSQVTLNKGATLKYPEFFLETRDVALEGEAFFDIAKDSLHPFKIDAQTAIVQVLGTSFSVNTQAQDKQGQVEVSVAEGKVMLAEKTEKSVSPQHQVILTQGEAAIYKKEQKKIEKLPQADPNAHAWKTKTLLFDRTTLSRVLMNIEKAYQVTFTMENPTLAQCQLSGVFRDQPLEVLLETIEVTFDVEVVKSSENNYTIRGEGCPAP